MASPYLALMQSGMLGRTRNPPMFDGAVGGDVGPPRFDETTGGWTGMTLPRPGGPFNRPVSGPIGGMRRGFAGVRRGMLGRPGGNMRSPAIGGQRLNRPIFGPVGGPASPPPNMNIPVQPPQNIQADVAQSPRRVSSFGLGFTNKGPRSY